MFASLWRFIKKIFGFGPGSFEQKAIDLCSQGSGPAVEDWEIKKVYSAITIQPDNSEFMTQIKSHRDTLIKYISKIYARNDMHPWIRFV